MMDKLSYEQILSGIEELNAYTYKSILEGQIEAFNKAIDEFETSGIMEQEDFKTTRKVYRFTNPIFSIDGFYYMPNSNEKIDEYMGIAYGYPLDVIKELNHEQYFVAMVNHYDYDDEEIRKTDKRVLNKRQQEFISYIDKLDHLYDQTVLSKSNSLILDDAAYRKAFIDRVFELSEIRQKLFLLLDFELINKKNTTISTIDYKKMSEKDKISFLTKEMDDKYENTQDKKDVLSYSKAREDNTYIIMTNYLRGKNVPHTSWKSYHNHQQLSSNILFYIEVAMYLGLPSSEEIEKFLNMHGFTLNSDMCVLPKVKIMDKYYVRFKDLKRWIDAGLDYNLINAILGFKLYDTEQKVS